MRHFTRNAVLTVCLILGLGLAIPAGTAAAGEGMIVKKSQFGAVETLDRFEKIAKSKGITVFARIDHAAGAGRVGHTMAPTQVLIFGNPKMGTPLMRATRSIAIDLPLKLLAWEDDGGSWIAYNDPDYLAKRHGNTVNEVLAKMAGTLDKLTNAAITKQ